MCAAYVYPLPPLLPDVLIGIAGEVPVDARWFAVNLQCGPSISPRDDIALHLSPRFDGKLSKVVRNSLQQQNWGTEESAGHFPLSPGKPFEILVLVQSDHFKIAINGEHYTEFRYRLPLQTITFVAIDGDVILNSVRCEGASPTAPTAPPLQPMVSPVSAPFSTSAPAYSPVFGFGSPLAYQTTVCASPPSSPGGYTNPPYPVAAERGAPQPPAVTLLAPPPTEYKASQQTAFNPLRSRRRKSCPMPIPDHSPVPGHKSSSGNILKGAVAGVAAGLGAFALSKLVYPSHGFGFGLGHGLMKDLCERKWHDPSGQEWSHKWHKGYNHNGWGSSDSSSSESED